MPHSETLSDSQEGYETVAAVPILDGDTPDHNNGLVDDASKHSPSACQRDNTCIEHSTTTSDQIAINTARTKSCQGAKSLRPQTIAQRESKVDKKRKWAVLEPVAWHPARSVLSRLSANATFTATAIPLCHSLRPSLQGPFREVSGCVSKMLRLGQSTSLAVIGPQGVGKSMVCRAAAAHAIKESGLPEASIITVHLCGNLHKDELRALKYIARELCHFCGYKFTNSASVDDNIKFLEHVLQQMSRESRHVIFLLEDLECFLQECKSRVLYTLLDLLQRANVRAVVVGISCMISVLDLMEKRARSRFSHKVVVVHAPSNNSSREFETATHRLRHTGHMQDSPEALLASMLHLDDAKSFEAADADQQVRSWNESVKAALEDAQMKSILGCLSMCGINCSRLQDICRTFCCKLLVEIALSSPGHNCMSSAKGRLQEAVQHTITAEDPIQDILSDCSTLQIHIIEAALRLKQAARKISFQSIMTEYKHPQTQKCESGLKYTEQAVWAAFQSLKQKDVLFPVGQQNSSKVSLAKQQVDLSVSSADMRRLL